MKLRLTGKGFENYTGQMGVHYFKHGVSTNDVLPVDGIRIAATIGAIWEDGSHANIGDVYCQNLQTPAPTGLQQVRLDHLATVVGLTNATQAIAQTTSVAEEQFKAMGVVIPQTQEKQVVSQYSRDQLEDIADTKGLAGLREVGTELGVKAGSINELIERILEISGTSEVK